MPNEANYEVALKAEMKRVVRCFQPYSHDERADLMASNRVGHRQRHATGEAFFVHPDIPGVAFPRRKAAAEHALQGAA